VADLAVIGGAKKRSASVIQRDRRLVRRGLVDEIMIRYMTGWALMPRACNGGVAYTMVCLASSTFFFLLNPNILIHYSGFLVDSSGCCFPEMS
jgi:hypothetical protein